MDKTGINNDVSVRKNLEKLILFEMKMVNNKFEKGFFKVLLDVDEHMNLFNLKCNISFNGKKALLILNLDNYPQHVSVSIVENNINTIKNIKLKHYMFMDKIMCYLQEVFSKFEHIDTLSGIRCSISGELIRSDELFGYSLLIRKDKYNRNIIIPNFDIISKNSLNTFHKQDTYKNPHFKNNLSTNGFLFFYKNTFQEDEFERLITLLKHNNVNRETFKMKKRHIIEIIPSLMNKAIIEIINRDANIKKAVIYYCNLLRIFNYYIDKYPELKIEMKRRTKWFDLHEKYRHKRECQDVNEFLIISGIIHEFDLIKDKIFDEFGIRTMFWVYKHNINIELLDMITVSKIFNACKISWQIYLLSYYFKKYLIKDTPEDTQILRQKMDKSYGIPPASYIDKFTEQVVKIKNINCFDDIFMLYEGQHKSKDETVGLIKFFNRKYHDKGYG